MLLLLDFKQPVSIHLSEAKVILTALRVRPDSPDHSGSRCTAKAAPAADRFRPIFHIWLNTRPTWENPKPIRAKNRTSR